MATIPGAATPLTPPTDKPDALYEFVDGQWIEVPRRGAFASLLAFRLAAEMNQFAGAHKLGLAMAEVLFRLAPEGPARRPDVAYVAYDRWPYATPFEDDPPAFDVVPNLAVEVNSPSNTLDEIEDKNRDYFFAGVEQVWVIQPRHRHVYVYDAPDKVYMLSEQQELDGGKVLPGFRLALASLFTAPVKPS
jgi:Uma2 family endonuclease